MSLQEMLAKKASEKAAQDAVAPKILTGAEGSVAKAPDVAPAAPEITEGMVAAYKGYPKGSYLMLRQKHLILASGAKVQPDKLGVITPENDEQKTMLAYLLKLDRGLVALIPSEE